MRGHQASEGGWDSEQKITRENDQNIKNSMCQGLERKEHDMVGRLMESGLA